MDLCIIYIIQSNRPFHEILRPNIRDISEDFRLSFQGITNLVIELDQLAAHRKLILDQFHKELKQRHLQLLVSTLKGAPDCGLLPLKGLEELPGIKWRLFNLTKLNEQKKLQEINILEAIDITNSDD